MKIFLALVIILFAISFIGYRVYNKSHRSVFDEEPLSLTASELFSQFELNEQQANTKYLDKLVEVTGEVSEVFRNQEGKLVVVLKGNGGLFGISCTLEDSQEVQPGVTIVVRGFCKGYLSDVVVNNCKLINRK